ncbi:MAG TPA: heat-inducible transcriptional repressor HrcA [Candidatus Dormibacteraeota bacterium]|nr:heat-inducible transcriptional repressor HrcA [Candidatus Dormibacteraeota bacterium]
MEQSIPLDSRKQQILKAVVSDYTETGVPVGSHALAAKYLLSWSSATIRNELANLVDIGYLLQPHTSAGRIPSDVGYRYYVDFLMEEEEIPGAVRRQADPAFTHPAMDMGEMLESAAQALALITDSVSIVTGPKAVRAKLKHVDFVSLAPRHALLILVLEGNLIRQQPVELSREATQDELSSLAAQLNGELAGLGSPAVESARVEPADAAPAHPLRSELIDHILTFMRAVDARQDTMVVHDGVRNLLRQPEFGDVLRLQQVLDVVEEERVLGQVLASLEVDNQGGVQGVQMVIGAENDLEQLHGCSLVLTTYRAGETRRGSIGVLGPTRMRYPQVAPRLRYVSKRLGEAIERMLG